MPDILLIPSIPDDFDLNFPEMLEERGCEEGYFCPYFPRSCALCVKHFAKDYQV